MSEILSEKEDLSESKIADLNTYFEDEINKIIHEDESIDDESPEVGWNSEDEQKYYSKTINMDTIEEETKDELNENIEEETKDGLNETIEEKKEEIDELINKEEKKNVEEINESNKKPGFLCSTFKFVHELIDSFIKPFSK